MDYDVIHRKVYPDVVKLWWVSFMLSPEMAHWTDSKILEYLKDYLTQGRVWVGQDQTKQPWCFSVVVRVTQEQIVFAGGFVEELAINQATCLVESWIALGVLPYTRQQFFGLS
jgi:hypothetical protein